MFDSKQVISLTVLRDHLKLGSHFFTKSKTLTSSLRKHEGRLSEDCVLQVLGTNSFVFCFQRKLRRISETLPVIEKGTDVLKSEPNVLVRVFFILMFFNSNWPLETLRLRHQWPSAVISTGSFTTFWKFSKFVAHLKNPTTCFLVITSIVVTFLSNVLFICGLSR